MKRKGFSLIELLIVIGIIAILVAIVTWGFRHVSAAASARSTAVQLHACRSLITEYEAHVGSIKPDNSQNMIERYGKRPTTPDTIYAQGKNQAVPIPVNMPPVYSDPFPALTTYASVDPRVYLYESTNRQTDPNTDGTYWPCLAIADLQSPSGGASDMSDRSLPTTARYASAAVVNTFGVMSVLDQIPSAASLISKMPPERILEPIPEDGSIATSAITSIILDGWGNPIIFVPRGGMHVMMDTYSKDSTGKEVFVEYVVRSSGTFPASDFANHPLRESDRPFFASAGEDGDFAKGNDNIYSFQD